MAQGKVMYIAAIEAKGLPTLVLSASGSWLTIMGKAKRFSSEQDASRAAENVLGTIDPLTVSVLKVARQWALVV